MLRIVLDYDDTYTADPVLFDQLIELAQARGHEVVVATAREESWPINPVPIGLQVVYCAGRPKRTAVLMALPSVRHTIFIDDLPHLVDLGLGHPAARELGLA